MIKDYLTKLEGWARFVKSRVQEDKRLLLIPGAFVACAVTGGIVISAMGTEETVEPVSLVHAGESISGAQKQANDLALAREANELARMQAEASRQAAEEALLMAQRQAASEEARLESIQSRLSYEKSARSSAEAKTQRLENRLAWLEQAMDAAPASKPEKVVVKNDGPSWWEYDAVVTKLENERSWHEAALQEREAEFARRKASLLDALRQENEQLDTLPVQLQPWQRPTVYSINYRPLGE